MRVVPSASGISQTQAPWRALRLPTMYDMYIRFLANIIPTGSLWFLCIGLLNVWFIYTSLHVVSIPFNMFHLLIISCGPKVCERGVCVSHLVQEGLRVQPHRSNPRAAAPRFKDSKRLLLQHPVAPGIGSSLGTAPPKQKQQKRSVFCSGDRAPTKRGTYPERKTHPKAPKGGRERVHVGSRFSFQLAQEIRIQKTRGEPFATHLAQSGMLHPSGLPSPCAFEDALFGTYH